MTPDSKSEQRPISDTALRDRCNGAKLNIHNQSINKIYMRTLNVLNLKCSETATSITKTKTEIVMGGKRMTVLMDVLNVAIALVGKFTDQTKPTKGLRILRSHWVGNRSGPNHRL
ncbi:hypothetical protein J6590_079370 [Homalodisca vitripennis]|nr:hypothetical protein J6590_079370 [Homalodisca vitripennis]